MHSTVTPINRHFNETTNAHVEALIAHTQSQPIRSRKFGGSCLDQFLPEIITKHKKGWSYQRIADAYKNACGRQNLNRSTVMKVIKKFMKGD